jgi:hypothetical protein
MRSDRNIKKISDVFIAFPTVVNRMNVQYGLGFLKAEDSENFSKVFSNCLSSLQKMRGTLKKENDEAADSQ